MLKLRREEANKRSRTGKRNKRTNAKKGTSRQRQGKEESSAVLFYSSIPPFAAWKDTGIHERHTKPSYLNIIVSLPDPTGEEILRFGEMSIRGARAETARDFIYGLLEGVLSSQITSGFAARCVAWLFLSIN